MFREVSSNSYSIAAIFGEHTGDFNKPKIIGLDQSFLNCLTLFSGNYLAPGRLPA
jgi:hypothetical protein